MRTHGPFDRSPLIERPFVEFEGRYVLAVPGMVLRDTLSLFESRLLRDARNFSRARAKTLDALAVRYLAAALPGSRSFTNLALRGHRARRSRAVRADRSRGRGEGQGTESRRTARRRPASTRATSPRRSKTPGGKESARASTSYPTHRRSSPTSAARTSCASSQVRSTRSSSSTQRCTELRRPCVAAATSSIARPLRRGRVPVVGLHQRPASHLGDRRQRRGLPALPDVAGATAARRAPARRRRDRSLVELPAVRPLPRARRRRSPHDRERQHGLRRLLQRSARQRSTVAAAVQAAAGAGQELRVTDGSTNARPAGCKPRTRASSSRWSSWRMQASCQGLSPKPHEESELSPSRKRDVCASSAFHVSTLWRTRSSETKGCSATRRFTSTSAAHLGGAATIEWAKTVRPVSLELSDMEKRFLDELTDGQRDTPEPWRAQLTSSTSVPRTFGVIRPCRKASSNGVSYSSRGAPEAACRECCSARKATVR